MYHRRFGSSFTEVMIHKVSRNVFRASFDNPLISCSNDRVHILNTKIAEV